MNDALTRRAEHRGDRATEIVAHEAARWIQSEASSRSLITVTRAESLSHGEQMTVYVTVYPETEARVALAFLDRGKRDFRDHLAQHARLKPLPVVTFLLDDRGPGGN